MNAVQARTYIRLSRNGWLLDRTDHDGSVVLVNHSGSGPDFVEWIAIDRTGKAVRVVENTKPINSGQGSPK